MSDHSTNVKGAAYKDRLLLFLPEHLGTPYTGSRGMINPRIAKDITLADGFDGTADYMRKKGWLDDSEDRHRQSVLKRINDLSADDVGLVIGDFEPGYKGRAGIFFADISESNAVVMVHATSGMYDI